MLSKLNFKTLFLTLACLIVLSMILVSCAPPAPEVVIETVEVEKEVIKTVEVEKEVTVIETVEVDITTYGEAPALADMVASGALPPVEERLPENPLVVLPVKSVGEYGGIWHRGWRGPADFQLRDYPALAA
jgi:hypothetical protein